MAREYPLLVNVGGCWLAVRGHGGRTREVAELAQAFKAEDMLYGLVPRIEGSCRKVAIAFEKYLKKHIPSAYIEAAWKG